MRTAKEVASVDLERSRKLPRSIKCSVVAISDDVPGPFLHTLYVFCVMRIAKQPVCRVGLRVTFIVRYKCRDAS